MLCELRHDDAGQQASFGRCVSMILKVLLMRSSSSDTLQPSTLCSPPHAGQAVSAGASVWVLRGHETGSGLRTEDCRCGCGSAGSCCSPKTSAISFCRALMRSSASHSGRAVFPRRFFEAFADLSVLKLGDQCLSRLFRLRMPPTAVRAGGYTPPFCG